MYHELANEGIRVRAGSEAARLLEDHRHEYEVERQRLRRADQLAAARAAELDADREATLAAAAGRQRVGRLLHRPAGDTAEPLEEAPAHSSRDNPLNRPGTFSSLLVRLPLLAVATCSSISVPTVTCKSVCSFARGETSGFFVVGVVCRRCRHHPGVGSRCRGGRTSCCCVPNRECNSHSFARYLIQRLIMSDPMVFWLRVPSGSIRLFQGFSF